MYRSIFIVLLATLCSFAPSVTADLDLQVMQVAESQLGMYLSKIEPGQEASFGFEEKDDFDLVAVGKPYRIINFNKEFYSTPLRDYENYITIQNQWRVPVTMNGQSRVMLDVAGNPGNLNVTAMEGMSLARELQQKSAGASDSDEFYILLVPNLSAAFFVHENDNSFANAQFTPLSSAILAIPALNSTTIYTLTQVQNFVKEAVSKDDKGKDKDGAKDSDTDEVKEQPKPKKKSKS